jgi:hypothetical protein
LTAPVTIPSATPHATPCPRFRVLRVKAWLVERHISVVLDIVRAAL